MSDPTLDSRDDGDPSLPNELATLIERARQRTASPAMVERFAARVLEMTAKPVTEVKHRGGRASGNSRVYWLCAVAASIGVILSLRSWVTVPVEHADVAAVELLTQPVYSPITTVSLTQVGYLRIHEDLDRADSQVEEVSEGLAIAAVRHEIQVTLEVFYDWSK